jgi:hypothetical protein
MYIGGALDNMLAGIFEKAYGKTSTTPTIEAIHKTKKSRQFHFL